MVAAITVFHAVQAGFQAFTIADAADTEVRQDFVQNDDLLAGLSDSQNQIVVIIEALAGEKAAFVICLFRDERGGMVPVAAGGMLFKP